eukprot:scaffold68524_cov69-Phaeocystis_antarctica.AAC.1
MLVSYHPQCPTELHRDERFQPLSVCLSCSSLRQLPAPVCTKLRSKAPVAVTSVLASCDGNPLSTHTEASTKLITAHQAHHCDDHTRSQNRDKVSLPKHRASISSSPDSTTPTSALTGCHIVARSLPERRIALLMGGASPRRRAHGRVAPLQTLMLSARGSIRIWTSSFLRGARRATREGL